MLIYIVVIGGIVILVVYFATRSSGKPVTKPSPSQAKVTDYDNCEHTVDANGFIKCTGSQCSSGQNCTLQSRFVGKDPWKDVDMQSGNNNVKFTQFEFRCVCK